MSRMGASAVIPVSLIAAGQILKDVAKSKSEARRERALAGSAAG